MRIISDSCVTIFVSTPLRVEQSCKDNCAQAHCPSRGSASSETFFFDSPQFEPFVSNLRGSAWRHYQSKEVPLGSAYAAGCGRDLFTISK